MAELKLKANQAALILEASEEGGISVNVASLKQKVRQVFLLPICAALLRRD